MSDLHAELVRCDAEIARIMADVMATGPRDGALLGLADWSANRRLVVAEMEER